MKKLNICGSALLCSDVCAEAELGARKYLVAGAVHGWHNVGIIKRWTGLESGVAFHHRAQGALGSLRAISEDPSPSIIVKMSGGMWPCN